MALMSVVKIPSEKYTIRALSIEVSYPFKCYIRMGPGSTFCIGMVSKAWVPRSLTAIDDAGACIVHMSEANAVSGRTRKV